MRTLIKSLKFRLLAGFTLIFFAAFVYATYKKQNDFFSQAGDFPRGALVYLQTQDLPKLAELWDKSALKAKYLESTNFSEFQNRHLALKLVSRLNEFENALGFAVNYSVLSNSAVNKAACAVYDIGKLEFVFIAPFSEEKLLALQFFQNKSAFEETTLSDKTIYYSKEVEADRGRQKQKVLFTFHKGKFVIATEEKIFLRTLANLNGKSINDRLFDEADFKSLAQKTEPHLATVWVNQEKLNTDWYFKHYWLLPNSEELKKIRAGIFDIEMREEKLTEKRLFLMRENPQTERSALSGSDLERIQRFVPENVPYFNIKSVGSDSDVISNSINSALFDETRSAPDSSGIPTKYDFDANYDGYYEYGNYSSLGRKFDSIIDDDEDAGISEFEQQDLNELFEKIVKALQSSIEKTQPSSALLMIRPNSMPLPSFFECRKAVIFSLKQPQKLDQNILENSLSNLVEQRLTIKGRSGNLHWINRGLNQLSRRELNLPMLNWKIVYTVRNHYLILSNSSEFLEEILQPHPSSPNGLKGNLHEFTVIRLDQRNEAFDNLMKTLQIEESKQQNSDSSDFFVDNIGSLLDVLSEVSRIEINRTYSQNMLYEELNFILKK